MAQQQQQFLDFIVRPSDSITSCAACKALFTPHRADLENCPLIEDIQRSAETGCVRCGAIWDGVSKANFTAAHWPGAIAFGTILTTSEYRWLRVGIKKFGTGYLNGVPREWIDFYNANDEHLLADKISPSPPSGTREWYKIIKTWIELCDSNHTTCARTAETRLPKRVLDLSMQDGSDDVALYESNGSQGKYIALSYCWGTASPLKTLRSNIDNHKTRIKWTTLPVLFKDAIAVARSLGVKYLWIDSLCIIQQDDADWKTESAMMAHYYGNAWLTIAASSAPDSSHGCFPRSRQNTIPLAGPQGCEPVLVRQIPKHFNMKRIRFDYRYPVAMPLFDRAWTYQERLLSRRTLHFGPEEVVWECSLGLWCECGETPDIYSGIPETRIESFRESHNLAMSGHYNRGLYWQTLLEMYLVRNLSFEDDKLKAIEGLAKQIQSVETVSADNPLGDYVLGFWSTNMPSALLWTNLSPEGTRNVKFPSWSWASITGPWTYQSPPDQAAFKASATFAEKYEEIWDVERPWVGRTYPFKIASRVVPGKLSCQARDDGGGMLRWKMLDVREDADMVLDVDMKPGAVNLPYQVSVVCLELGTSERFAKRRSWGLVLEAVKGTTSTFQRVGVLSTSADWYHGASTALVNLI